MRIEAVIFDLDGVIVDTAVFHYQAWQQLAREFGFEFSEKHNERLKGVSRLESLEILLEVGGIVIHSDEEKEKLATKKNNWYRELILKMTPGDLLPGAKEFLQELKGAGYKIAIGSSSKNATTILERIKYLDYFDAIVDGNKIKNSKPDPEVFLKAAAELGIKPGNCVVFEDAQAGVEAAIRAGMKTVGVGSPETLSEADIVIPNLKEAGIAIFSKLI